MSNRITQKLRLAIAALMIVATPAAAAVWQWSLTPASNSNADPTLNWAEGMSPSAVNDSARAEMSRIAEWRDDFSGKLVTSGTSTAYTLTTNQGFSATPNDGQLIAFRPHVNNGTSATLRTDGGNIYPLQTSPGTAVAPNTLVLGTPYSAIFNSSQGAWILTSFYSTAINLDTICNTRGAVLERGASGWVCINPGAAGTVFQSNGSGADPAWTAPTNGTLPQGYLTPVSGQPIITADSTGATAIYYTPYLGNLVPIYNGSVYVNTPFTEQTLTLSAGSQAISNIYDVFAFSNSGTFTIAFGPSWTAGGGSVTVGSGARGTGVGSTALTRLNGILVNSVAISAANNGATTYSIAANQGTYLGSVFIDTSAGQVTNHISYGQTRKRGIWNYYNRQQITIRAGDGTASWAPAAPFAIRFSNNSSSNYAYSFVGVAEEPLSATVVQFLQNFTAANTQLHIGIGFNSSSTVCGKNGTFYAVATSSSSGADAVGKCQQPPALGVNAFNMLESATNGNPTFSGTEAYMLMTLSYRG